MFPLKLIRKIGKILRGSAGKPQTVIAVTLGMLAAFSLGANLTFVAVLLLLLLLNANLGLFLFSMGVGKAVAELVEPASFHVGRFLLQIPPVESAVRTLVNAPVTALLGLERYTLLGGLPIALALGVLLGLWVARLVAGFRRRLHRLDEASELWEKLNRNLAVRGLKWILFGKKPGKPGKRHRLIRRGGLIAVVVGAVLIAVVGRFAMPFLMRTGMKYGLERFNGAEVNVGNVDVSLLRGRLYVRDFQMADAKNLDRNLLEFEEMGGRISFSDLLRKRLVLEEAQITRARLDTRRETPARRIEIPEEAEPEEPPAPEGKTLEDYVQKAKKLRQRLEQVKYYLDRLKQLRGRSEPEKSERLEKLAKTLDYDRLQATYLVEKHPRFLARLLAVREMAASEGMAPLTCEVRNLSSDPALQDQPTTVDIKQSGSEAQGKVSLNYHTGEPHNLDFTLPGIPLSSVSERLGGDSPVRFEKGRASVSCSKGSFTNRALALPIKVVLTGVKASPSGEGGAMGLSGDVLAEALGASEQIETLIILGGPISNPGVTVDTAGLAQSLQKAAVKAGKDRLQRMLQDQAGGLLEKAGSGSGAEEGTLDRMKDLLGGDEDDEEKKEGQEGEQQQEEEQKKTEDRVRDALDLLK